VHRHPRPRAADPEVVKPRYAHRTRSGPRRLIPADTGVAITASAPRIRSDLAAASTCRSCSPACPPSRSRWPRTRGNHNHPHHRDHRAGHPTGTAGAICGICPPGPCCRVHSNRLMPPSRLPDQQAIIAHRASAPKTPPGTVDDRCHLHCRAEPQVTGCSADRAVRSPGPTSMLAVRPRRPLSSS